MLGLLFCFPFSSSFAQNDQEIAKIVSSYDLKKLSELQKQFYEQSKINKQNALAAAKLNNWLEFIKNEDGSVDELIRLTPDGQPMYYSVDNKAAARSTRANFLNTGGGLGLTLDGQGMTARVWDGGNVRTTHQEFETRVNVIDNPGGALNENSFHSTHVTGTIGAKGIVANAKGMAPMAQVRTFDWTSDSAEALTEIPNGMLLSNHSYGVPIVSRTGVFLSPSMVGSYSAEAREWDIITYNAPYYLMVVSAGNDGQNTNSQPTTTGYDKLVGNKVSKNNLVVANTNDANVNANGELLSVSINSSSSQGPSDDFRIKPDISGNGTQVYSTYDTSNTAYANLTGTSMAAPNVTGTLLLLQQHYNNTNGHFMKAATLKALACHTADDAGRVGPDAIFGWGLLNAKKAAETINENGLESIISELTLAQGETYTTTISSNGMEPLNASIVWADVAGIANNILNNATPALINDLDIRITKNGTTYYPWRLQSNATLPATNSGDNNVDTVERVTIPAASGTYTLTVTHKGNLQQGPQNFSLVVTGITSSFSLASLSDDQTICSTESAAYSFKYATANTQNTVFSAVGLPTGATASFSSASLSANGQVTMTLSNWQNVTPGEYTIGIKGQNGLDTKIEYVKIRVYSSTFQNTTLLTPANNSNSLPTNVRLEWTADANADSYRVQVSNEPTFSNLITNVIATENNYVLANLDQESNYYWRILPKNNCGETTTSANFYNFSTGIVSCGNTFTATDFSTATITTLVNAQASVPVTVTGGMIIGNLSVSVNLPHTALRQLTVYLEGPDTIGSPKVTLFEESCGDNRSINAIFSDTGTDLVCGTENISVTGTVKPFETLTSLNGLSADGVWKLVATDNEVGNGGRISGFSLSFCNVTSSLSVDQNKILQVSVYPNPTKGIININLADTNSDKTVLNLYDIQGRKILSKESHNSQETLNIENLSDGIYMLSIESGNLKTTKKVILSR